MRENERILIEFLLNYLKLRIEDYPFSDDVDAYEGDVMGSISLGGDTSAYAGDLIQVKYIDSDSVPVIITLTKDDKNQLLDLDFWKEDFSKLITYPSPDELLMMA